jgi:hypothetical protein
MDILTLTFIEIISYNHLIIKNKNMKLIVEGIKLICCCIGQTDNQLTINNSLIIEGIKLIGGIAGLVSLGFKVYEEIIGYLKIKVQVFNEDGIYSALTEIENTSKWSRKKIDNAFLIISPENFDLIEVGRIIAYRLYIDHKVPNCIQIEYTNDFEKLKGEETIYIDNKIAFIPLQFYYNENIAIGDEKLTYRCLVDKKKLQPGSYSVRFYIFGEGRYHRSTQDLLVVK